MRSLGHTSDPVLPVTDWRRRLLADQGGERQFSYGVPDRPALVKAAGFRHSDKLVAYVGLDIWVWESTKWRGQRRASKRGSG